MRIRSTFVSTCVISGDSRYISCPPVSPVRIIGTFCVMDEDHRHALFPPVSLVRTIGTFRLHLSSVRITGTFVSTCVTGEDRRYVLFTPVSSV